jgi:tRNA pseudouridine38-40 synthase
MARYKLLIEYDGTGTVGWQRQADEAGNSIQGLIEAAIAAFAGHPVTVNGAGRTDAGVHAAGQVAHVDLARVIRTDTLRDAANAHLRPHAVTVVGAEVVDDDFDARFSATARHYLYRIFARRPPPALERDYLWHVPRPLDVEAMHAAAQLLVGHHDFTTFRSADCQAKSPMKTLDRIDVSRAGIEIHVSVSARSFLHNQVRSMVGSLRKVGDGSWTARDLRKALDARDRTACGPVAPAAGLCLVRVDYPPLNPPAA